MSTIQLPVTGAAFVDPKGNLTVSARASLDAIIRRLQDLADLETTVGTDYAAAIAALELSVSQLEVDLAAHEADTANPHATTAAQVGADPVGTAAAAVAAHEADADPHPQYRGVPYFIASGETYTVPQYVQSLFSLAIDAEGWLDVQGYLIEAD